LCPRCLGALNFTVDTVPAEADDERKTPPTPAEIAPYFPQLEILECLGRGGMGVVYKARQKSLGRLVALKLLAPEREKDAQFAERFSREAQALAQLAHPNIVTIHDFGLSNGYFFLLMEYVDGINLRELLRTRRLSPEEALAIVPPLCEALQYAHVREIVHRDIKPENLLLAKDGRIKVVDFGIAKMLGADAPAAEEKPAGTPGYMAPEQRQTPQRVDGRADIYSLGVVFYEMLTGELPPEKLAVPPRKITVDVRIDQVVLRALERSPDMRWQTAEAMRTHVEAITSGPGTAEKEGWHPERQRAFWFLALPTAVALFILNRVLMELYSPATLWSHTYRYGPNYGLILLTANALTLCATLDIAVLRALWIWAHTAPGLPALLWRKTRPWWAAALCCLVLPWILLPSVPRIQTTNVAPPVEPITTKNADPPGSRSVPVAETPTPPVTRRVWHFSRYLSVTAVSTGGIVASPPTWVPSDPPLLLIRRKSDIAAFSTAENQTRGGWSIGIEGENSGPPVWDERLRRIYFCNGTHLYAVGEDGRLAWTFVADAEVSGGSMWAGGRVIFGDAKGAVFSLDTKTGVAKWMITAGTAVTSGPAVVGDMVIIGMGDGAVLALDPQTANEKWRHEASAAICAPIVSGGNAVFLATRGGDVVSLDSKTGKVIWRPILVGPTRRWWPWRATGSSSSKTGG
jgi:serine/threonine protein kinase